MRIDVNDGRRGLMPAGWVRCLGTWLTFHLGSAPHGPFGGWIECRLVASKPKPAHIAGRSTIVERLVVDVVYSARAPQSFERAFFVAAFEALRDRLGALAADPMLAREGYDIPALLDGLAFVRAEMPADDASLERVANEVEAPCRVQSRRGEERWRTLHPRSLDRPLHGLRAFGAPDALELEMSLVLVCLEAELRKQRLHVPGYREIYFRIAPTLALAERACEPGESWSWNTPTVLDALACASQPEHARCLAVLDALERALLRLAVIDHLDVTAIRAACAELRDGGFEREVVLASAENETYRASVLHQARRVSGNRHRFRLRVVHKSSNRSAERDLGHHATKFAPHLFSKIQITKSVVRVSSRPSLTARISRDIERVPEQMEYAIGDLFPVL